MTRQSLSLFVMLLATTGCKTADHYVGFRAIEDNLAYFDVINRTTQDVMELTFELTYTSANRAIVLVDTVGYTLKKRDGTAGVFLGAGDSTFFVQRVPEGTASASARVIGHR